MKLSALTPENAIISLVKNKGHGHYDTVRIELYRAQASDMGFTIMAGPDDEFCVARVYIDDRMLGQSIPFPDYIPGASAVRRLRHLIAQRLEKDVEVMYKGKLSDSSGQIESS